ncbi:unnamed protein product [Thlaspi arvense]|uniref:arginine--tRNA ligase n=1 Tax=Thlaspi arvense TaxID=13288 RepID=A0AAU9RW91_THLAR|nr:unnamed protein product [Thlaspi arvense]
MLLYRQSKEKFDKDPDFKEKAQRAVVRLQGGDPVYVKPWLKICEISRTECSKVINRLQVDLEEKGESFYKPYIANVITELDSMGLVEQHEGARVVRVKGFKVLLMLVKSDGGFNYDTTDMAALWYADLRLNRTMSFIFSYDQMLSDKGDTAVCLLYTHTRIYSIIQKSGKDIGELKKIGKISLDIADERALGLLLLQFAETVEKACTKLLPNILCEYLYNLSEHFTKFYTNCKVNGSAEVTSRLLLCEAKAIVIRKCFHLLGITPVYKM